MRVLSVARRLGTEAFRRFCRNDTTGIDEHRLKVILAATADSRSHEHTGGGYKGFCDYEEIKAAIKECDGLDGARLEACYAEFGCDVDRVTEHYARAAGIEKKQRKA